MAEKKSDSSKDWENEIKCIRIYSEKDTEQNKYVRFTFNIDGYVCLIYSETGQSWEPGFFIM